MCNRVKLKLKSNVSGLLIKITDDKNNVICYGTTPYYVYCKEFFTSSKRLNISVYPLKLSIRPTVAKKIFSVDNCYCNCITANFIFSDYRYRNKFTVTDEVYGLPVDYAILSFTSV